jgi:hypothetical protein
VDSEYIYISLSHRQSSPNKPNYETSKDYFLRMEEDHGLIYEPLFTFKKRIKWFRCFKVKDKVKALEFVFKFSKYIEKPET